MSLNIERERMSKKRVLIATPLAQDLLDRVAEVCEVVLPGDSPAIPTPEQVAELLPGVQGVLTTIRTRYGSDLLSACPGLEVISNNAVGFDNIDMPAATAAGVLVCNTPKVLDRAVADLTVGLIIALARQMPRNDAHIRSGGWLAGNAALTQDIDGKTLGLVGMGRIGKVVARVAAALGMRVIYFKPSRDTTAEAEGIAEYRPRDQVFSEADFVSIHAPLDDSTRASIGAREFSLMKSSAYFINTSRGGLVDEPALIRALQEERLAGAGLDVMATEPIGADHPLCALPNVILQPHVGSATVETRRAMIELAVRNLLAVMTGGRAEAMVNPQVLERSAEAGRNAVAGA